MRAINDAVMLKTQLTAGLALITVVLVITSCSWKLALAMFKRIMTVRGARQHRQTNTHLSVSLLGGGLGMWAVNIGTGRDNKGTGGRVIREKGSAG